MQIDTDAFLVNTNKYDIKTPDLKEVELIIVEDPIIVQVRHFKYSS